MMDRFDGQRALVTGSSRGIGAAVARLLHQQGSDVVLHGRSNSNHLQAMASELKAGYLTFDVANQAETHKEIEKEIVTNGAFHILINCAGVVTPKPMMDITESLALDEYRTNVLGTMYCCQAVIPSMRAAGYGRIVNISSVRGYQTMSSARGMVYSMSKASIINLTASLAKECAPHITVNSVAPGFTETDMAATWNEAVWSQARSNLVGRPAKPEEIAAAILFMASPAASFITGQTLLCDGGYEIAGK